METVQMLNLILAVIILLIFVLGVVAVLLIVKMRTKKANKDVVIQASQNQNNKSQAQLITRNGKAIDSIYKFMEFDEVIDNMIIRKNREQYVAVIQCKGINYDLLSEDEKNAVEAGFIELLNTLRYQIQLYIQTRTLNLEDLLNEYTNRTDDIRAQIAKINGQIQLAKDRNNIQVVEKLEFDRKRKENILEYGESIEEYTKKISESKNILQQKTYIVVSYFIAEYGDTSKYSKEELDDIAFSELYTRVQTLIRALTSAEVTGKMLNSEELSELLYVAYNRDSSENYSLKNALNAQYDRLYSTARDVLEEKKQRIDRKIEEDAAKLAAKSIIKADEITREERARKVKEKASEMVSEYKNDLSGRIYNEAKNQIEKANVEEELKPEPKKRIVRKRI